MTKPVSNHKPRFFLKFVITLVGLYLVTGWAGIIILRPTPQPFFGSLGIGGAVSVREWWQYFFFGLYNMAVWICAYVLAARVVPKLF